jgi:polysaccharide biosynthesis/export protein
MQVQCDLVHLHLMLMKYLILLTFFVLPILNGCSSDEITKENLTQIMRSGSRPVQSQPQSENYIIRQGDQIQLTVWGYPEFSTTAVVKESGTIEVPLIGEMQVLGLRKEQFSQIMKKKLAEYIQGEIKLTVAVSSTIPQKIAVLGSVSHQENYAFTADASLLEVLSAAGGTTPESDLRHIKVLRRGVSREPVDIDLTWYLENGDIEGIPMIRPGDTVFVPKKGNVVRELSDFMRDAIFIFGFFRVFN